MGAFDTTTARPIESPGIYQSSCACRTAVNLYAGDTAPRCLSCGDRVMWRMVQAVHQRTVEVPRIDAERWHTHGGPDVARVTPRVALDSVVSE